MPPLKNLFNSGAFINQNRELPNEAGSYTIAGGTNSGYPALTAEQIAQGYSTNRRDGKILDRPIFTGGNQNQVDSSMNKYINPATGQQYTPAEYAAKLRSSIPLGKGQGDVPQYARDAMMNPTESTTGLETRATNLNNARNDIAVGQTDPFDITKGGDIVYSPEERAAIEKAYAGVYDPALNDVFARLKERKAIEEKKLAREESIFQTNENIRQWKATYGLDSDSGKDLFTRTQLNNGAANSGLGLEVFEGLDSDIKNFYINPDMELNPKTNKMQPQYESFANLVKGATSGQITSKEAADEILTSTLPQVVKLYFIDQLPLDKEEKKKWYQKLADWIAA